MLQATPHQAAYTVLPSLKSFVADLPALNDPKQLLSWYTDPKTDPLHPALLASIFFSVGVWIVSEITGNVSQVDRLWTTLPLMYSAHFTLHPWLTGQVKHAYEIDHRILLVFALQCAWSARLTYQSARRGFLDPRSEDYRWPIVRRSMPTLAFKLLNLVFIAFIQNFLLLAAEAPVYLLMTQSLPSYGHTSILARLKPYQAVAKSVPLNVADVLLAGAFFTTLVLEMRADNQQQAFQRLKHGALDKHKKGKTLTQEEKTAVERGFVADGLWSWSRHPNFACEQTTWWLLYAFTVLPFLPITKSFTSHPLSTLSGLLTPTALLPASKRAYIHASKNIPTLDYILTILLHPILYIRASLPHLTNSDFLRSEAARAKLEALTAFRELRNDEGHMWNYSIVSPITMSLLFYSSTVLTEKISGGKYPLYEAYKARVAKFWPVQTPLKGLYLALTGGRRGRIERQIWGSDGHGRKIKQL